MAPIPKSMQPPNGFVFDTPEGRPFRVVSIETEVDAPDGGYKMATALHNERIVHGERVQAYGYHPGNKHSCIAFLKHDGTVTGGELVFDRMDLSRGDHAAAFYRAHEVMRGLEKEGSISFNPNCGGHIHMDASGYGFYDVLRLIVAFGHIEEPIFRLAGAGKTYGHRTLYKGRPMNGEGYSNPVVKGPFGEIAGAFAKVLGQKRHTGLNVSIYSANACHGGCPGTVFQYPNPDPHGRGGTIETPDLKKCRCPKSKFTLEWRVWNAQGNPRIMYAWVGLMQALHAYCWRPGDLAAYEKWDVMEPFSWETRPFAKLTPAQKNLAQGRVEWMFTELPLTAEEKDALSYSYQRTPYKEFGKRWFGRLADTPYKAPPYKNRYKPVIQRQIGTRKDGTPWAEGQEVFQGGNNPFDRIFDGPEGGAPPGQGVRDAGLLVRAIADLEDDVAPAPDAREAGLQNQLNRARQRYEMALAELAQARQMGLPEATIAVIRQRRDQLATEYMNTRTMVRQARRR